MKEFFENYYCEIDIRQDLHNGNKLRNISLNKTLVSLVLIQPFLCQPWKCPKHWYLQKHERLQKCKMLIFLSLLTTMLMVF